MFDRCATCIVLVSLALSGCDKIQGLIGGDDDAKADDAKADDTKTDDTKTDDTKIDDTKVDDIKADDTKADDIKADDTKVDDKLAEMQGKLEALEAERKELDKQLAGLDAKLEAGGERAKLLAEKAALEKKLAEGGSEASPAPAAASDQPCIVGHWEATDYLALINRALRKDPQLAKMTYKSKSGTIGYVVEPLVDGKGVVKATASDLKYKYGGKVQGINVALAVTMSGDITAEYKLEEPSRIVIADPTENNMKVKARVTLKGLGTARDSSKVRHEFDGDFPYECTDTKLTVWSLGKDKRPLEFKRLDE